MALIKGISLHACNVRISNTGERNTLHQVKAWLCCLLFNFKTKKRGHTSTSVFAESVPLPHFCLFFFHPLLHPLLPLGHKEVVSGSFATDGSFVSLGRLYGRCSLAHGLSNGFSLLVTTGTSPAKWSGCINVLLWCHAI